MAHFLSIKQYYFKFSALVTFYCLFIGIVYWAINMSLTIFELYINCIATFTAALHQFKKNIQSICHHASKQNHEMLIFLDFLVKQEIFLLLATQSKPKHYPAGSMIKISTFITTTTVTFEAAMFCYAFSFCNYKCWPSQIC